MKWEEPGRAESGPKGWLYDWDAIIEKVEANPGRWLLVDDNAPVNARQTAQARGLQVAFRGTKIDDVTKRRHGKMYVRYPVKENTDD